jgi:hypothetical protein
VPSFQHRRLDDGSRSVIALVRIKGFKSISKAFRDEQAAKAWASATETELRRQRDRGASADATRTTIRSLCDAFLKDPKTNSLKAYYSLEALLAWWMNEHGHEKTMGFGVAKVRAARETLLLGDRSPLAPSLAANPRTTPQSDCVR